MARCPPAPSTAPSPFCLPRRFNLFQQSKYALGLCTGLTGRHVEAAAMALLLAESDEFTMGLVAELVATDGCDGRQGCYDFYQGAGCGHDSHVRAFCLHWGWGKPGGSPW